MTLLMIPQVRTTIEDTAMIFYIFLSYGLGIVIKKSGRFVFLMGVAGAVH